MIIDSLPELLREGQTVTAGALYLRYTNRWLEDPAIRPTDRQSSSDELRGVLEALAVELWRRDGQRIHHADLYRITGRGDLRGRHDPIVLDVDCDRRLPVAHARRLLRLLAPQLPRALRWPRAPSGLARRQRCSVRRAGARQAAERAVQPELAGFFGDLLAAAPPPAGLAFVQHSSAGLLADPGQLADRKAQRLPARVLAEPPPLASGNQRGRGRTGRLAAAATATPRTRRLPLQRPGAAGRAARRRLTLPTAPGTAATSTGADLHGATAERASFRACRMAGCNLAAAVLEGACFRDADTDGADLRGAERPARSG